MEHLGVYVITGGVISLFISWVLRALVSEEVKAWSPVLIKRFTLSAVKRLPAEEQERYAEEWTAAVADIPGNIGKFLFALDLHRASLSIRRLHHKSVVLTTKPADTSLLEIYKETYKLSARIVAAYTKSLHQILLIHRYSSGEQRSTFLGDIWHYHKWVFAIVINKEMNESASSNITD
jgi:hypothetical protein